MTTARRGGRGGRCYRPSDATGDLVGAAAVDDNDNILICGAKSSIVIPAKDLPRLGRVGAGNICIKGTTVQSITKI